jgi:hypothetical protein
VAQVFVDISMSLDGFIAGPNQTLEQPLGEGGEGLHEWAFGLSSWRAEHGLSGGATGPDDEIVQGGANVVQQYLRAGLVDKLQFHVVPLLLGDGVRLFDALGEGPRGVKVTRMITSPAVTHLRYSVVK